MERREISTKFRLRSLMVKRLLGRLRRRWKDSVKLDLEKKGWWCRLDLSGSGQKQVPGLVITIMSYRVP